MRISTILGQMTAIFLSSASYAQDLGQDISPLTDDFNSLLDIFPKDFSILDLLPDRSKTLCFLPISNAESFTNDAITYNSLSTASTIGCLLILQDDGQDVSEELEYAIIRMQDLNRNFALQHGLPLNDTHLYTERPDGVFGPNSALDFLAVIEEERLFTIIIPEFAYADDTITRENLERFSQELQSLEPITHTRLHTIYQQQIDNIKELMESLTPDRDRPEEPTISACTEILGGENCYRDITYPESVTRYTIPNNLDI